jgi:uncharacterized protein with PQ loop repeat
VKKVLYASLIGLFVIMALSAAAPPPPVVPVVTPEVPSAFAAWLEKQPLYQNLGLLWNDLFVALSIPAIAVALGNLAKIPQLKKWLDGKTDKVVGFLTTVAFFAALYFNWFNPELLAKIMPWLQTDLPEIVSGINVFLGLIMSWISIPAFHSLYANKFVVGKSFNTPARK